MRIINVMLAVVAFSMLLPLHCYPATSPATITPVAVTDRTFRIYASNLTNAGVWDFSLRYDPLILSEPITVTAVGIAAKNVTIFSTVSTPGVLRLTFLCDSNEGISGTGDIATVEFTKVGAGTSKLEMPKDAQPSLYTMEGNSEGIQISDKIPQETEKSSVVNGVCGTANNMTASLTPVTALCSTGTASAVTLNGSYWGWSCTGANGGSTANCAAPLATTSSNTGQTTTSTNSTTNSSSTNFVLGSVAYTDPIQKQETKKDEQKKEEAKTGEPKREEANVPPVQQPVETSSGSVSVEKKAPADVKDAEAQKKPVDKVMVLKALASPLQRIRDFKGARTVKNLADLFDTSKAQEAGIKQMPPIAIADGKALVTLTVDLEGVEGTPSFTLRGANLKGMRQLSATVWELKVVPQKGKYDVHLTVMAGKNTIDVPLVVVPTLDQNQVKETQLQSEKDVAALLARAGAKTAKPVFDLNGDGKQDAVDEYILIAHYLLKVPKPAAAKPQK